MNSRILFYTTLLQLFLLMTMKKDMVNRGGEKIWCTDVEDELIAFISWNRTVLNQLAYLKSIPA